MVKIRLKRVGAKKAPFYKIVVADSRFPRDGRSIEEIGNYRYLVSPDSFFQININTCFKLYSKIKQYIKTNKNVLDLYCGTGSIGIFVSEKNNVLGVELNIEYKNNTRTINLFIKNETGYQNLCKLLIKYNEKN